MGGNESDPVWEVKPKTIDHERKVRNHYLPGFPLGPCKIPGSPLLPFWPFSPIGPCSPIIPTGPNGPSGPNIGP